MTTSTSAAALDRAVLQPERLARYADTLVRSCLRLAVDDMLFVSCRPAHRELAVALAECRAQSGREPRRGRLRRPAPRRGADPPGTRWLGGREENAFGQVVAPNFPTEENFTSPDAAGTEGTFRCSRPLSFRGRMIHGIAGEFRRGRLVRLEAASDEDRDLLAAFLASDRDASRLGEAALVDRSSRIGQTERVYSNTLIDENAAAHIAFGAGFGQTRVPDRAARGARGVNGGKLHLDVMVGTDEFEATGVTSDGRRVELLSGGAWQRFSSDGENL